MYVYLDQQVVTAAWLLDVDIVNVQVRNQVQGIPHEGELYKFLLSRSEGAANNKEVQELRVKAAEAQFENMCLRAELA